MSIDLPTVGPGREPSSDAPERPPEASGRPRDAHGATPPSRPATSSFRLVLTLALAGAIAGFFIVLVHQWSEPRIEAHRALVLAQAVDEVLASPASTSVLWLVEGGFTTTPPPAADTSTLDRVWLGLDENGVPVGVAAVAAESGFQDVIRLIFGYDPGSGTVLGMKVLESRETPGLGDKIEKDSAFVAEFRNARAPLRGVKPNKATGAEGEIDMITGATISSEAIVDIINNRLDVVAAPLERFWSSGDRGAVGDDAVTRYDEVPDADVATEPAHAPGPRVHPTETEQGGQE